MKHLEGKTVYLIPTGNAARRWDGVTVQAVMVKVARVNVTIRIDGSRRDEKWRISLNGKELSENNSGYKVFDSLESLADYKDAGKIARIIREKFSGYGDLNVSVENLRKVADILGINWRD